MAEKPGSGTDSQKPKFSTRFQKGASGNPGGMRRIPPELKAFRKMSYNDFLDKLQKYGCYTRDEMEDELARPDATMFEVMFCNLIKSAADGHQLSRKELLDRLWGKPEEASKVIDVTGSSSSQVIINIPDNGRLALREPDPLPVDPEALDLNDYDTVPVKKGR